MAFRARVGTFGLVLVLLALVAVASHSRPEDGGAGESTAAGIATVVLLAIALTAIGAVGLSISGYALLGETRRRTKVAIVAAALLVAPVAVALVLYDTTATNRKNYVQWCQDGTVHMRRAQWAKDRRWGDGLQGGKSIDTGRPCSDAGGGGGRRAASRGGAGGGDANLLLAAVGGTVLALLIAAVIVALVMRRRRTISTASTERDLVLDALDESLDDLRRERDIRRAIIACYARMERALERAGSARRPAEAPFDYLVRILERIAANGQAARVLTELFERAKFSVEPMGEQEKQQAIEALELLRAEVSRPL